MQTGTAPVKYIVGVITSDESLRNDVIKLLTKQLGEPDFISKWYNFDQTNFYAAEMGENLKRSFLSFEKLMPPELIYKAKLWCSGIEDRLRENGNRRINLDPGYVDYFKVVLASGKYGGHKIAVSSGCWADFIMTYSKGKWNPTPWCFPDFTSGIYDDDLKEIRRLFKIQRQKMGS